MTALRLGLVGLAWGERVARAIASEEGLKLAACHARTAVTREDFATRFGCRAYATYEELVADPSLDGIVVMSPNAAHAAHALAALAAGKHVLVTKPIAVTLEDGRAMIAAARAARRVLAIGHQSRRQPAVRRMKAMLDEGLLGAPVSFEGNASSPTGLHFTTSDWRASQRDCPGGPLLQLGIHYVDNAQYLLGPISRVAAIFGGENEVGGAARSAHVVMTFAGGATGTLTCSYLAPSTRWMRVSGRDGQADFDLRHGLRFHPTNGGASRELLAVESCAGDWVIDAALRAEIAEFADCIRSGRRPETDGADGLRNLAVVLAAVKSHASGRTVEVGQFMLKGTEKLTVNFADPRE